MDEILAVGIDDAAKLADHSDIRFIPDGPTPASSVINRLVPVIPMREAATPFQSRGRVKPGHDKEQVRR